MDQLKKMAETFDSKLAYKIYTVKCKDVAFDIKISQSNFAHLIGLNRFFNPNSEYEIFRDINNLKEFNGYLNVVSGRITLDMLSNAKGIDGQRVIDDKYVLNKISNFNKLEKIICKGELFEFNKEKFHTHLPNGYMFSLKEKGDEYTLLFAPGAKVKDKFFPTSFLQNTGFINQLKKIEVYRIIATHIKTQERKTIRGEEININRNVKERNKYERNK